MRNALLTIVLTAGPALADIPAVVTDIAPVHSLVAQVMGDLAEPVLLLGPQSDPHHVQLRPSQARAVARADLVVWIGEALTPWLPGLIERLGNDPQTLDMLGLATLPTRIESGGERMRDGTDPETHADDHNSEAGQGHAHGDLDPHAWLDPINAAQFLHAIAAELSKIDPENADVYLGNADEAAQRLDALTEELQARLAARRDTLLIPYHDAYRYFFARFDLHQAGSLAATDAAAPGARHLAEIRALVEDARQACVFTEPGANPQLIAAILPDETAPQLLDPLGSALPPGTELYEALIRRMASAISNCSAP